MVRVKVACKDSSKVPKQRLFEIQKSLYVVYFKVESSKVLDENGDEDGGDDMNSGVDDYNGDEEIDHDLEDLDKPT
jgi:hypothetical protein